jgi:hypothetical protein
MQEPKAPLRPRQDQPCQRWREGRIQTWRRPGDGGFDAQKYGAAAISEREARAFVIAHHYSGSMPATLHRFGMFRLEQDKPPALAGVAILSVPASRSVLTAVFPRLEPFRESCDLGRFVLAEHVESNGESWFLAEVRRLAAARGVRGIVSFSDPLPRTTIDGTQVKPGHIGLIYQVSSATYTGRGTPRTLLLLPNGTVFSPRAMQKIRAQERGHRYAEQLLISLGARVPRAGQAPSDWLAQALAEIGARRVRHPGNYRYAFRVGDRKQRAAVVIAASPAPYPSRTGDAWQNGVA